MEGVKWKISMPVCKLKKQQKDTQRRGKVPMQIVYINISMMKFYPQTQTISRWVAVNLIAENLLFWGTNGTNVHLGSVLCVCLDEMRGKAAQKVAV